MSEAVDAGRALGELLWQAIHDRRMAMPSEAEVNAATTRLQGWIDANVRHAASEHMADVATLLAAVEAGREAREVVALRCEKCGGTDIGTEYHTGYGPYTASVHIPGCASINHNRRRTEHLHRICRSCHWDWCDDVAGSPMAAMLNADGGEAHG